MAAAHDSVQELVLEKLKWLTNFGKESSLTVNSRVAKFEYFLTPSDLVPLEFDRMAALGCGNSKLYWKDDLYRVSLAKHGKNVLINKLRARAKRTATKRKREAAAEEAKQKLAKQQKTIDLTGSGDSDDSDYDDGNSSSGKRPAYLVSRQEREDLQQEIRDSVVSQLLTWDYLHKKGCENGARGAVTIKNVEQRQFASMAGLGHDPELTTLVKKGAWYTVTKCSMQAVFGEDEVSGSGSNFDLDSQLGVDKGSVCLKFAPSMKRLSVRVYVAVEPYAPWNDY